MASSKYRPSLIHVWFYNNKICVLHFLRFIVDVETEKRDAISNLHNLEVRFTQQLSVATLPYHEARFCSKLYLSSSLYEYEKHYTLKLIIAIRWYNDYAYKKQSHSYNRCVWGFFSFTGTWPKMQILWCLCLDLIQRYLTLFHG